MQLIASLAAVVAPAFLISLAGYLWARRGLPFDQTMVTHLITLIGAPCLVFSIFTKMRMPAAAFANAGLACCVCLLLFGVAGTIGLRMARLPVKVYLPSLIFPNVGNMGIPICLFAFGEQGMAYAMIYFAITVIGQFTIGIALATGEFRIASLLRLPFIYVTAFALALNAFGIEPPAWLTNTADVAGGLTVPLMLMALGAALAQLRVGNVKRALAMSIIRVGLGGAGGWVVARLFGMDGAALGVMVIQSAMPVAVFNYLFASLYGNDPEEVAGMVLMSTALAYLGLPMLVAVLT